MDWREQDRILNELFNLVMYNRADHRVRETNAQMLERATRLLDTGVNLNTPVANYGKTLLHRIGNAINYDSANTVNLNILRLIIERGANVNLRDEYGNTPLWYALRQRSPEVIHLLLDLGADLRASGDLNRPISLSYGKTSTPLQNAVKNRDERTLRALLEAGADVNSPIRETYGFDNIAELAVAPEFFNRNIFILLARAGVDLRTVYPRALESLREKTRYMKRYPDEVSNLIIEEHDRPILLRRRHALASFGAVAGAGAGAGANASRRNGRRHRTRRARRS